MQHNLPFPVPLPAGCKSLSPLTRQSSSSYRHFGFFYGVVEPLPQVKKLTQGWLSRAFCKSPARGTMGAYRQQRSSTFNAIMLRESDFTEMALHSLESLWQCLTICIELKTYIEDSLISNRTTICALLSLWVSNTSGVEIIHAAQPSVHHW